MITIIKMKITIIISAMMGNLREFLEQIVYRPPGEKLPVRLWAKGK